MNRLLNIFTLIGFYAFVTFAPINWITLVKIGGLSVKYMHLVIIPLCACVLFANFRKRIVTLVRDNAFILASFILLLLANFILTYINGATYPGAITYIAKNFSYGIYFILFASVIYFRMRSPSFEKEITYSNTISILVFTLVASIIFATIGRNFLGDMANFFIKGDSVSLRYDLFKTLFNTDSNADSEIAANLRNTLIGAFIYIHFSSHYAFKNLDNRFLKYLNVTCILFSGFFILASVSRSNILVLMVGYFIYFVGEIFINRNMKKLYQLIVVCFIGASFAVIFWPKIENAFSDSTAMISGRLGELEDDARWSLDAEAIDGFSQNFLTGKGSGATLSDGHSVHNFIIGSAYQAGIFGLLLSLFFYFGIIGKIYLNMRQCANYNASFFIIGLTAIPLLRTMESGSAGTLSLVEWFCLASFCAFATVAKEDQKEYYAMLNINERSSGKFLYSNN